ncbi:MAG TPA: ATP-binding protein, partial [Ktedonobacteraceae bacterium]
TLIEDIIAIHLLRSEEIQWQPTTCDVGSLCREIIEDLCILSGRHIKYRPPSEPVILQADYERLHQAIANIVDNAIKYSPENTESQVYVCSEPPVAILEVHNEDAELSQEQQERIFEPFYRTSSAEALSIEGWGLGLAVSKACIDRLGGQIRVKSSEGKGVTFIIELPLDR